MQGKDRNEKQFFAHFLHLLLRNPIKLHEFVWSTIKTGLSLFLYTTAVPVPLPGPAPSPRPNKFLAQEDDNNFQKKKRNDDDEDETEARSKAKQVCYSCFSLVLVLVPSCSIQVFSYNTIRFDSGSLAQHIFVVQFRFSF